MKNSPHEKRSKNRGEPIDLASSALTPTAEENRQSYRNPLIDTSLSADLRTYRKDPDAALEVDRHNQPFVKPENVNIISVDVEAIARHNVESTHTWSQGWEKLFHTASHVPTPEMMVGFSRHLMSGVSKSDQLPEPASIVPLPLRCLDVPLYALPGRAWQNGEMSQILHPLRQGPTLAMVPLIGSFHVNGEELAADILDTLGIASAALRTRPPAPGEDTSGKRLRVEQMPDGSEKAQLPFFLHGGRSVLMPWNGRIPMIPTPEGGMRVVDSASEFQQITATHESVKAAALRFEPAIAAQYIGIGMPRYVYHAAPQDAEGRVQLKSGEFLIHLPGDRKFEGAAAIQQSAYAGKSGMFLDQLHQPSASAPTGAMTTAKLSYERDRLLLRHGAKMSGVIVDYLTVFTKDELDHAMGCASGMVANEIQIAVRAVLDDTHRLDVFAPDLSESLREKWSPDGVADTIFQRIVSHLYGEWSEKNRDRYLQEISTTAGHNLKICLNLGFTVLPTQRLLDNISIRGGLLDSENLRVQATPYHAINLVRGMLHTVEVVHRAAGIDLYEPNSGHFAAFAKALGIPDTHMPRFDGIRIRDNRGQILEGVSLTSAWIEGYLRDRKLEIPEQDLLATAVKNPLMRASLSGLPGFLEVVEELRQGASSESLCMFEPATGRTIYGLEARREIVMRVTQAYVPLAVLKASPAGNSLGEGNDLPLLIPVSKSRPEVRPSETGTIEPLFADPRPDAIGNGGDKPALTPKQRALLQRRRNIEKRKGRSTDKDL